MEGFPLSPGTLERYRLATRKRAPAGQVGAHLLRHKGQSLEFHDFAPYHPGDDYRHIDWRASARLRRPRELLVRRYQAEEQLTLAISIDNRPSMTLLAEAPKLRLASWLAYAVTAVAAVGGDRVLLHRLFGASPRSVRIRGKDTLHRARSYLDELARERVTDDAPPELFTLDAWLRPASVWVILTDLYFPDEGQRLARAVAQAQRGLRWVILVDLAALFQDRFQDEPVLQRLFRRRA